MLSKLVTSIAVGVFIILGGSHAYAGVDPGDLCKEKKAKAAGRKAADLLRAFSKNTKRPVGKLAVDISKAQSKFTKAFTKAGANYGDACPFLGDAADVELAVDDAVAEILSLISIGSPTTTTTTTATTTSTTTTTLRFVDNGDGTITDNQTGLMWEKKEDGSGCLHCVGDLYDWTTDSASMFDWVSEVNGLSSDGTTQAGLGGRSDWRIPTSAELQTILLEPFPCSSSPCIDPIFGPTDPFVPYWSSTSTTSVSNPFWAWFVDFNVGGVSFSTKVGNGHVRAVRGGSPSAAFLDVTSGVLD